MARPLTFQWLSVEQQIKSVTKYSLNIGAFDKLHVVSLKQDT